MQGVDIMSSELSLTQTHPSERTHTPTNENPPQAPGSPIFLRLDALVSCLKWLSAFEILTLMCVKKFNEKDKDVAFTAILQNMVSLIPQVPLEEWHRVLEGLDRRQQISDINNVYLTYVKGHMIRGHVMRGDAPCSNEFIWKWLQQVPSKPIRFGGLVHAGYFASDVARKVLISYMEKERIKYEEDFQIHSESTTATPEMVEAAQEMFTIHICCVKMIKHLAETSFGLVRMKIMGQAWDTWDDEKRLDTEAVRITDPRCKVALYVCVQKKDVEALNEEYMRNPELPRNHFRRLCYDTIGATEFSWTA